MRVYLNDTMIFTQMAGQFLPGGSEMATTTLFTFLKHSDGVSKGNVSMHLALNSR